MPAERLEGVGVISLRSGAYSSAPSTGDFIRTMAKLLRGSFKLSLISFPSPPLSGFTYILPAHHHGSGPWPSCLASTPSSTFQLAASHNESHHPQNGLAFLLRTSLRTAAVIISEEIILPELSGQVLFVSFFSFATSHERGQSRVAECKSIFSHNSWETPVKLSPGYWTLFLSVNLVQQSISLG